MKEKILKRIEIYPKIISELKKSEREILIVSDWLTEENIFDILIEKQEQGVKVKLILEDYVNSKALKFSNLRKAGGEIYKIEKNNFGLMHKRYCVIDEKIAVFTLANWSPYVLVQGHESLIVTGHTKTIKNFKVHFSQIMSKATRTGRKKLKIQ